MPQLIYCSSGYKILNNHKFKVEEIREYKKSEITNFLRVFDSIHKLDQECRTKSQDYFNQNWERVDSITFIKYVELFKKSGYLSFNRNVWRNWMDSTQTTKFLLKNYAQQLHYCDYRGFEFMRLIEHSISKKSCNEDDLMDFFLTYLWRLTEFDDTRCNIVPYKIVLLPNLENGVYSQHYKYTYNKFIEYCGKINENTFFSFRISNLFIDKNLTFNWSHFSINGVDAVYEKFIVKKILESHTIVEDLIKRSNPYGFSGGVYNVLICTYPKLLKNPDYNF